MRVAKESAAAEAGLLAGDLIVAANGVHVWSVADLASPPDATHLELTVKRHGERAPVSMRVALHARAAPSGPIVIGVAMIAWLLFVMLGIAPTARVTERLGAGVRAWAASTPTSRRGRRRRALAWRLVASLVTGAIAALFVLGCVVDATTWLVVQTGFGVAVGWLEAADALDRSRAGSRLALGVRRMRALVGCTLRELIPCAAIACAVLATGTVRLHEIVEAQGGWPWDWGFARSPIGLATGLCYAVCVFGARSSRRTSPMPERRTGTLRLVWRAGAGVLGALVFLGGWRSPIDAFPLTSPGGASVALVVVTLKAGVLALSGATLADIGQRAFGDHTWALRLLVIGVAVTGLLVLPTWLALPSTVAAVHGRVAVGVAVAVAAYLLVARLRRARAAGDDEPPHRLRIEPLC